MDDEYARTIAELYQIIANDLMVQIISVALDFIENHEN